MMKPPEEMNLASNTSCAVGAAFQGCMSAGLKPCPT
jgi:hypothetical protein